MTQDRLTTRISAVVVAAVAGTATALLEVTVALTIWFVLKPVSLDLALAQSIPTAGAYLLLMMMVGANVMMAMAVGLVLIGGPAWWGLYRAGRRDRATAVLAGAILAPIMGAILLAGLGGVVAAWTAGSLLLPGAAAGWTLHRVAYGRNPRP
jgi:hypothetical protein